MFTEHFQAAEGCSRPQLPSPHRSWYTSLICEVAVKLTSAKYRLRPLTRTLALTSDPCMLGTPGLLSTPKVGLPSTRFLVFLVLAAYSVRLKEMEVAWR